jgi:PadR family transcriptional regulator
MAPSHDPQLLKGVLSLLLLHLLAEQESYGYEVVQRLQQAGFTDVLEGSVYPALTRLERDGRVATRLVPSPSGPARKYYRLTPAGWQALQTGVTTWARHTAGVDAVLSRPLPAGSTALTEGS